MAPAQGSTTSSGVRHLCETCGKSFGRPQDVRRHVIDVHMPRRRCPFCYYEWSRVNKIKAHLSGVHSNVFSAENLQSICALRGQDMVVFLDNFESFRYNLNELAQILASSTLLFTAPS
ncbi:hypothetical protein EI94DRAFT_440870 [Lactarius quietus]|nr:hypothetical protein EI94DRAFT_440870 [Lactarius quietus]